MSQGSLGIQKPSGGSSEGVILPGGAIEGKSGVQHVGMEGHRRGEELGQDDHLASHSEGFVQELLRPLQVGLDVGELPQGRMEPDNTKPGSSARLVITVQSGCEDHSQRSRRMGWMPAALAPSTSA